MLTRWSDLGFRELDRSFAALNDFRQEMDRIFERFESAFPELPLFADVWADTSWPRIQMDDEGDDLRVVAEVPGFSADDLRVSLEHDTLTIRGERRDETPAGYSVHRKERGTQRFARAFTLPCRVDVDKVEAKLSNGILELRLPKVEEERPRMITVKAA